MISLSEETLVKVSPVAFTLHQSDRNNLFNPLSGQDRGRQGQALYFIQTLRERESLIQPSNQSIAVQYLHISSHVKVTMTESAKLTNEQSLHLEFINVCSVRAPHERLRDGNITC